MTTPDNSPNRFSSGWKRSYYGKGDVIVYRLNRDAAATMSPFFGANVLLLIYGDAFWPTYTTGDNTGLVATDSMKNFIQRETANFPGSYLEEFCEFLGAKFLNTYPHAAGAQITATEIPYFPMGESSFAPAGPDRAYARMEIAREGDVNRTMEIRSGVRGFRLLRMGGSAFYGFIRDQYTTLPDIKDRPLHMWLDMEWSYTSDAGAMNDGSVTARVRGIVKETFCGFESGSIQQIIYQIGTRVLERIPAIAQVDLEANNRTWDAVAGDAATIGVYTDARPPYGCLGLSLKR